MDEVARIHRFNAVLQVGLHTVLVARVGVNDVPGTSFLEVLLFGEIVVAIAVIAGSGERFSELEVVFRFHAYSRSSWSITQLKRMSTPPSNAPTARATTITTIVR